MSPTVVPFGFGVGDFFDVGGFILSTSRRIRESPIEYQHLQTEADQFSAFPDHLGHVRCDPAFAGSQSVQITGEVIKGRAILHELKNFLDAYKVLASKPMISSKRITWDNERLQDLRSRVVAFVVMLQPMYLNYIAQRNQIALIEALESIKADIKSGKRKSPAASAASSTTISTTQQSNIDSEWKEIIRALEEEGITPAIASANKPMIIKFFIDAMSSGELRSTSDEQSSEPVSARGAQHLVSGIDAWMVSETAISDDSGDGGQRSTAISLQGRTTSDSKNADAQKIHPSSDNEMEQGSPTQPIAVKIQPAQAKLDDDLPWDIWSGVVEDFTTKTRNRRSAQRHHKSDDQYCTFQDAVSIAMVAVANHKRQLEALDTSENSTLQRHEISTSIDLSAQKTQDVVAQMRRIADKTQRETTAMKIFTITTVLFTPLSLLTSFYAINIDESDISLGFTCSPLIECIKITSPLLLITMACWYVFFKRAKHVEMMKRNRDLLVKYGA